MLKKDSLFQILIILTIAFLGCKENHKTPDVSKIKINIRFLRFEQDLFNADFEKLSDSISFFHKKYGEFFDIFNYKILRIGDYKNPTYPELLKSFITDYNINRIIKVVNKNFSNIDTLKTRINEAFRYFTYYFPDVPVPVIITYISGFNESMVTSDTILGIGLDKYLGSGSEFYFRLGLAHFQTYNMHKAKIVSDCIRGWLLTQFPMSDSADNLLANMIYQGKIIYGCKAVLPNEPDSLIFGMSPINLEWCEKNEQKMWTYLVENKVLFKTDYLTINKFVNDAPFTKDFGRNSPGRAANWLSFQIIKNYIKRNPDIGLQALMKENDYLKILRLSRYRP